jgi:hypothetical protein
MLWFGGRRKLQCSPKLPSRGDPGSLRYSRLCPAPLRRPAAELFPAGDLVRGRATMELEEEGL